MHFDFSWNFFHNSLSSKPLSQFADYGCAIQLFRNVLLQFVFIYSCELSISCSFDLICWSVINAKLCGYLIFCAYLLHELFPYCEFLAALISSDDLLSVQIYLKGFDEGCGWVCMFPGISGRHCMYPFLSFWYLSEASISIFLISTSGLRKRAFLNIY